jgi:hypothetical protein
MKLRTFGLLEIIKWLVVIIIILVCLNYVPAWAFLVIPIVFELIKISICVSSNGEIKDI